VYGVIHSLPVSGTTPIAPSEKILDALRAASLIAERPPIIEVMKKIESFYNLENGNRSLMRVHLEEMGWLVLDSS